MATPLSPDKQAGKLPPGPATVLTVASICVVSAAFLMRPPKQGASDSLGRDPGQPWVRPQEVTTPLAGR